MENLWLVGWIFGNLSWENTRPHRACVYTSIRQRFRTVHAKGYRSAQETLLQMMWFGYLNTMETTIGSILIR